MSSSVKMQDFAGQPPVPDGPITIGYAALHVFQLGAAQLEILETKILIAGVILSEAAFQAE
jgi:hypothetical protein